MWWLVHEVKRGDMVTKCIFKVFSVLEWWLFQGVIILDFQRIVVQLFCGSSLEYEKPQQVVKQHFSKGG